MKRGGNAMETRTTETASMVIAIRHGATAAVISLALLISGCGGSGGGSVPTAVNSSASVSSALPQAETASSFTITGDSYGVENATYLAATKSASSIVLRAAVASSMSDPNFKTVARIDVTNPQAVNASGVYSLGAATAGFPLFAGSLYVFNGHQSTLLHTVGGTISFTAFGANSGDKISGSFNAVVEDGSDNTLPSYTVAGNFEFTLDGVGPVLPAVAAVSPSAAVQYQANCASCHTLGSLDQTPGGAPELSLKGGRMNGYFSADVPGHQGIRLAASDLGNLKVLLNVN
jgi:hypothetical protein